ncbi:Hypothetical predicted protein [Podarcis lilfordi]|uniref:Uncharacterized protein n=1 Tax=Podarcis lilfordi TaxID=74358 RepID=A0AA35KVB2_9SAUR|nr:Hypothetical predicted protein [Podarcis lilfordi]
MLWGVSISAPKQAGSRYAPGQTGDCFPARGKRACVPNSDAAFPFSKPPPCNAQALSVLQHRKTWVLEDLAVGKAFGAHRSIASPKRSIPCQPQLLTSLLLTRVLI